MNRCLHLALLLAGLACFSACTTVRPQSKVSQLPPEFLAACQRLDVKPTKFVMVVNIGQQRFSLYENQRLLETVPCSTSKFGIGEVKDSRCTPRGLHRIAEKIGDDLPAGTVLRERQVVGHTSDPKHARAGITTRILWLDGLETGFNRGGNVDTHDRTVYIHGTSDQSVIGTPDSWGCVELADKDLIAVFDLVPSGSLVWITEK